MAEYSRNGPEAVGKAVPSGADDDDDGSRQPRRNVPLKWSDLEDDDDSSLQPTPRSASTGQAFTESTDTSSATTEGDFAQPLNEDDEEAAVEAARNQPHACRYCGYGHSLGVAKCNTCRKWFCNNRGCTTASHIVTHLVRSKHKEVVLHPDSPLGDGVLECYVCGAKNVFLLGFIPSKVDSVVVMICREPCLHSKQLKDMDWDPTAWQPIVEEKQLLSWLVQVPEKSSKETKAMRLITTKQMQQLEEAWKTKPDAKLDDLMREEAAKPELPRVPTTFADVNHYLNVFQPLIDAEAQHSREIKEAVSYDNVAITWETSALGRRLGRFELPLNDGNVAMGDELKIAQFANGSGSSGGQQSSSSSSAAAAAGGGSHHPLEKWSDSATIIQIEPSPTTQGTVVCELKSKLPPPADGTFQIKFNWKSTPFDRMLQAMKTMAEEETSISAFLFYRFLGQPTDEPEIRIDVPRDVCAPRIAKLNLSQSNAVRSVLRRPLSLIQGPPGTGKTVTSATIVYHMCKLNQAQVLVCSPSNVAVDHVAERIALTGLNVVRIAARSRESVTTSIDHLMLHIQVRQFIESSPEKSELRKLVQLRESAGQLNDRDRRRYMQLIGKVEAALISNADVVCCTNSVAADKRLEPYRFKHVLIDESTQAAEPECLIPLVMGCKQLVLVGDHCQMGPVILHRPAEAAGLGRSLFERLVELGERPVRLDVQYRMHPSLSEFSSNAFYEGTLQNGVTAEERDASAYFPWPDPARPMFFYNSISAEELCSTGSTYLNRAEAALAEKIVTHLIKQGATPDQIGVITPYEGQRCYLINYLLRHGLFPDAYRRIEVASVDSFQGREKEFIVLTCVRSNDHQGIGFLADWRRLNVALTRARRGLVVIGNARVLSKHPLWHSLLSHYKSRNLLVDGPIMQLKTINITLSKPRPARNLPIGPTVGSGIAASTLMLPGMAGGVIAPPQASTNVAGARLMYQPQDINFMSFDFNTGFNPMIGGGFNFFQGGPFPSPMGGGGSGLSLSNPFDVEYVPGRRGPTASAAAAGGSASSAMSSTASSRSSVRSGPSSQLTGASHMSQDSAYTNED